MAKAARVGRWNDIEGDRKSTGRDLPGWEPRGFSGSDGAFADYRVSGAWGYP